MASTFPCLMPSCEELLARSHLSFIASSTQSRAGAVVGRFVFEFRATSFQPRCSATRSSSRRARLPTPVRAAKCPAPRCRTPRGEQQGQQVQDREKERRVWCCVEVAAAGGRGASEWGYRPALHISPSPLVPPTVPQGAYRESSNRAVADEERF